MKNERQEAILKIIAEKNVNTQNQLLIELARAGVETTQATVSRDIKDLHLLKEQTPSGDYCYVASDRSAKLNLSARLRTIFKESVTSYSFAQNIVVIKTLPGLAPAACGAIDAMGIRSIVGTIAGDDTGFLAMTDTSSAERLCKEIEVMLKR